MDPVGQPKCEMCGEPMPAGEEMFKYHGYSGPCPAPPMARPGPPAFVPNVETPETAVRNLAMLLGMVRAANLLTERQEQCVRDSILTLSATSGVMASVAYEALGLDPV